MMNVVNSIRMNNNPQISFKAERIIYPNEFVFDDIERKKPVFDFSNTEEKPAPIAPKKEPFFKKMSEKSIKFLRAAKQYYNYKNSVKKAVKINIITKERAKQILEEQRIILLSILKK